MCELYRIKKRKAKESKGEEKWGWYLKAKDNLVRVVISRKSVKKQNASGHENRRGQVMHPPDDKYDVGGLPFPGWQQ